ncbi:MAG: (2Fe-2S)-binding protein [Alphaproteobacteria bacterium]|nr:(2Fe-2S)-binding protein [Alphaproteobacteria bacterium]
MSTAEIYDPVRDDEATVVCGCAALTLGALRRRIAAQPELGFENLLASLGAGTTCTACLLDLEYHFVEARSRGGHQTESSATAMTRPAARRGWREALYAFLDAASPPVAYRFNNPMPVLYGPGIEQWLWIVNRSLLFEGRICAPTMRIELILRDAEGRTIEKRRHDVAPETTLRVELSGAFQRAAATPGQRALGVGSVEIKRRGLSPGIRGTTRPQVEVLTPRAACAVHSQAMAGPGRYWFTCLDRPEDERMFFSILNGSDRRTVVEMTYLAGTPNDAGEVHRIELAPRGAALHEMRLARRDPQCAGAPVSVSWQAAVPHKVHAICASVGLDRFSIDHL